MCNFHAHDENITLLRPVVSALLQRRNNLKLEISGVFTHVVQNSNYELQKT